MNQVTAILIGAGARGQIYARYAQEHPEELRIIAVAEPKADRRALMCRATVSPLTGRSATGKICWRARRWQMPRLYVRWMICIRNPRWPR